MAWRRQFQGQFGINETPLTVSIENGDFALAEEIINACVDPTLLNDGPYENIPLRVVLSNDHHMDQSRNLKVAKLLVVKGANPNLRVPYADLDQASPSPFEELVVYYEMLRSHVQDTLINLYEELDIYMEEDEVRLHFLTNTIDLDGAKCTPCEEDCRKLLHQTSELIDLFLECGSDPNVITTFAHKTLFHWVMEHEDIALSKRFLNTCRVNLNLCDIHGSSPLMGSILRNHHKNSLCLYEAMCDTVENIDLNSQNCCGETALFRAVFVGAIELASKLFDNGALPENRVCLAQVPVAYPSECDHFDPLARYVPELTTPLFGPLLTDAPTRLRYAHVSSFHAVPKAVRPHKHLIDKIISSSISPLVDLGCLRGQFVASQTANLLSLSNFQHLEDGRVQSTDLNALMFGQLSSGLRQLCVRTVFDHVVMNSNIVIKLWPELVSHELCIKECQGALTVAHIDLLVEKLSLPQSFKIFFEIEAAKYQICKYVMGLETVECDQACSESWESSVLDEDGELSIDTDYSSDLESFMLFASDDVLSENSSSELNDLSDDTSGSDDEDDDDDEEEDLRERDETNKEKKVNGVVHKLKKVSIECESLSSDSDNIRVLVETMCENVVEEIAQNHHSSECCENYQRLSDEYTVSSQSVEDVTASEPLSDASW